MSATTDFFDTHRMQCLTRAEKLRSVVKAADAGELIAEMDAAVALCDAAIAAGRKRVDMPAIVTKMPAIVQKYDATSQKTKTDLREALKADADPREKEPSTRTK